MTEYGVKYLPRVLALLNRLKAFGVAIDARDVGRLENPTNPLGVEDSAKVLLRILKVAK